jgi:hypothetical protein
VENPKLTNDKIINYLDSHPTPIVKSNVFNLQDSIFYPVIHNNLQHDKFYTGKYDSLFVLSSKRVILDSVQARYLEIRNSEVTIKNSNITGNSCAIKITASEVNIENSNIKGIVRGLDCNAATVEMTAVFVKADTGISTQGSRFDIAGGSIRGSQAAVAYAPYKGEPRPSEFIFSVSKVYYGDAAKRMHGAQTTQSLQTD